MPKMPAYRLNDFVVECGRVINETFDVSEHGFLLCNMLLYFDGIFLIEHLHFELNAWTLN